MLIGSHVVEFNGSYVNLTTKKVLPCDSAENVLSANLFGVGQGLDSVKAVLDEFSGGGNVNFHVIPTWRCNLRCSHCFVMHKLQKSGDSAIDVSQWVEFLERYKARFPDFKSCRVTFVGGEATLNSKLCLDFIAAKPDWLDVKYGMTSNGTILDDDSFKLFQSLDDFTISVDGTEFTHNMQRKSLDGFDPYSVTYNNIKRLIWAGLREQLHVQAALSEEVFGIDVVKRFHLDMLRAGVKFENIKSGTVVPTRQKPVQTDLFKSTASSFVSNRVCCKYRTNSHFIVDDGGELYADYFESGDVSRVGYLTDEVDVVLGNYRRLVSDSIPILNDPVCVACPVVGLCWGMCANIHNRIKPSSICDQAGLIRKVEAAVASGSLLNLLQLSECGSDVNVPDPSAKLLSLPVV